VLLLVHVVVVAVAVAVWVLTFGGAGVIVSSYGLTFLLSEFYMKKIVQEVENEGFMKLLGSRVTLFCANYIYTGVLTGFDETYVLLTGAEIVYETGALTDKKWKDAQPLPNDWYVSTSFIESFGLLK